jgi:hypothetical protein
VESIVELETVAGEALPRYWRGRKSPCGPRRYETRPQERGATQSFSPAVQVFVCCNPSPPRSGIEPVTG